MPIGVSRSQARENRRRYDARVANIKAAEDAHKESREKAQRKSVAKQTKAKRARSQQSTMTTAKPSLTTRASVPSTGHVMRIIEGANVREVKFDKAGRRLKPTSRGTSRPSIGQKLSRLGSRKKEQP